MSYYLATVDSIGFPRLELMFILSTIGGMTNCNLLIMPDQIIRQQSLKWSGDSLFKVRVFFSAALIYKKLNLMARAQRSISRFSLSDAALDLLKYITCRGWSLNILPSHVVFQSMHWNIG